VCVGTQCLPPLASVDDVERAIARERQRGGALRSAPST
jgi:hypothetical protein